MDTLFTKMEGQMNRIKYGIISTASIVPRFINAVREINGGEIVGISSRDLAKSESFAEKHGIPKAYGSHIDLLQDEDINTVYIASINSAHFHHCKDALDHGKNVICEKPFTRSPEEAEFLFNLAKEKGLFLVEAQKSVFLPIANKVKEIIGSGQLGDIHLVDFSSSSDPGYNQWINSKEAGGGTLYGNASYFMHLTRFWFEDTPRNVIGMSNIAPEGADSQCIISFKMREHIMVVSKISYDIRTVDKAIIYGKNGRIEIPDYWKARKCSVVLRDGTTEHFEFPCEHELRYELEHYEHCIKEGLTESPVMSREMTVKTLETMEYLRKQWY